MMRERTYPDWWHERAALRKTQLDEAVTRIRAVVCDAPDIIGALIFGSYARNTIGPDSDLDVMLVTTISADSDPGLRYARLRRRLALRVSCDLIVYERDQFDELLRTRAFVAEARAYGTWIDATTPA